MMGSASFSIMRLGVFLGVWCMMGVNGFVVPPPAMTNSIRSGYNTALASKDILSEIDTMCIMNQAELCSDEGSCDVDDIDALVNQLKDQLEITTGRMKQLDERIAQLEVGNQNRDVNSLKSTMRGIGRIFRRDSE
mmetsp:Transcript_12335/g.22389  ORF Transcript_12335/g.22389 Transcript_12335/m.22389 type:complete len:135 (-) Transcript_12335:297-701(-)